MEYLGQIMKSLKAKRCRNEKIGQDREDWRAATNQSLD
jgi:hypothetical protein